MSRRALGIGSALLALLFVAAIAFVILFIGGRAGVGPLADPSNRSGVGHGGRAAPARCPLTDVDPEGDVPNRPALAVKVENLPSTRPQTGLSWADIVYEEPVEAGITRFIAVYQCQDAARIMPVRSARMTDPRILVQFGSPLFAYAGGVPQVVASVRESGLIDVNYEVAPQAYERDPAREAPHDLVTGTPKLYAAASWEPGTPQPVFQYSRRPATGRDVAEIRVPFSSYSDVSWRWDPAQQIYVRYDTGSPHLLSDGSAITAANVIVQMVEIGFSGITDVNGAPSPEVIATGTGKAYVLRGGKLVEGRWIRERMSDVTRFVSSDGETIYLRPGNTWVELTPSDIPVAFG